MSGHAGTRDAIKQRVGQRTERETRALLLQLNGCRYRDLHDAPIARFSSHPNTVANRPDHYRATHPFAEGAAFHAGKAAQLLDGACTATNLPNVDRRGEKDRESHNNVIITIL